jgi:hypothetical protein
MGIEDRLNKPPIYDKDGRITDPKLARKAADIENPYHKRTLFKIFRPSKKKITEGEKIAE